MKSGAINLIRYGNTANPSRFPRTRQEKGHELKSSLELTDGQTTFSGGIVRRGRAMREEIVDGFSQRINDEGELEEATAGPEIRVDVADIALINDEILITQSTSDEFARSILSSATDGEVVQGKVDIPRFIEDHPEAKLNMAGSDLGEDLSYVGAFGNIQSVEEIPEVVRESPNIQLGFEQLSWNGKVLNGVITKSGYISIFSPKDTNLMEYCQFILDDVVPYVMDS